MLQYVGSKNCRRYWLSWLQSYTVLFKHILRTTLCEEDLSTYHPVIEIAGSLGSDFINVQRADLHLFYRSPLNPQQDPELPAQFHLVEHGLSPSTRPHLPSKAPRRLPRDSQRRGAHMHHVGCSSSAQRGRAHSLSNGLAFQAIRACSDETAIGLGMADLIEHPKSRKDPRKLGSRSFKLKVRETRGLFY